MRSISAYVVMLVLLWAGAANAASYVAILLADALVLRVPDSNGEPIWTVKKGASGDVIAVEGEWVRVSFEDAERQKHIGYVRSQLVAIVRDDTRAKQPAPALPTRRAAAAPASITPAPPISTTKAQSATVEPSEPPRAAASRSALSGRRAKQVKIRGYVTEFRSPTDFDIEDYRILRDEELSLDFENASPEVTFHLSDIRVGVELEIKGTFDEQTGELRATTIKVDLEQFKTIEQTAFVSAPPEGIQLLDGSWAGELRADGQIIRVTDVTAVVFKPTKREKKLIEQKKKTAAEEEEEQAAEPLRSLDQVTVGMAMTYEGRRDRETGKIIAQRIEFSNNDLEDGESKMWKSLKTTVKPPQGLKDGELKIDKVGKYKLLPDAAVQAYVATLGQRLIPAYQRDLTQDDPRRIPFQFHVVVDKQTNAFATPNGIVIVTSGLMEMLDNEAQLAAIVGHEIAHSTHEHTWRQQQHHKNKRLGIAIAGAFASAYGLGALADIANMVNGAVVNGHQRQLENQSDRIGLQYMVDAGYDPREAPAVWKLMAKTNGVSATNFFWSSHDNAPTRRSYLMNELKNNYRDLNYSQLQLHADEYLRVRSAVTAASGKKTRIKVR